MNRQWEFSVTAKTLPGEVLAVVGSCPELGNWNHEAAFFLTRESHSLNEKEIWSGSVCLPLEEEIHYRYMVCIIIESAELGKSVIVRRWETNLRPRIIEEDAHCNQMGKIHLDLFGTYDGETKVDRGWLSKETIVQLKMFNNPVEMWKKSLRGKVLRIKVTPVDVVGVSSTNDTSSVCVEESWDVQEVRSAVKYWPIVEVADLKNGHDDFRLQEQFGQVLEKGAFLIFQVQVMDPESVTYLVDFYAHDPLSLNAASEHVGFCYVLQNNLTQNQGAATVPITSPRHQAIGQLRVEYLIVRPMSGYQCDMSVSYSRHWKHTWRGLEVGHRGAGSSFKDAYKSCASIRENTIASMRYAATHGADMIEFDVQLTKDLVPVIYHDFYVSLAMKKKLNKGIDEHDLLQLPVKDLTMAQLQMLKVYHVKESNSSKFNDDEFDDHQPFPTLQCAFEHLDSHVGFNVEIKWTMQLKDGTFELYHPFEANFYVDTIVKTVLQYAGSRKIVFSCFHPDICTMLRVKQNKYPVLFLTQGVTAKYPEYHDPRTHNIPNAVRFALSIGMLGIDVHTEDLLRDPSQVALVQSKGLILFCWGEDNNDQATIRYLKNLGLNGIIYDKIDVYSLKETKESIFLVEAREAQRQLMQVAASKAAKATSNGN